MTVRTHHRCFSGDPTCSGVDRCPACEQHFQACVLPLALRAGGFDGGVLADLDVLVGTVRAIGDRLRSYAAGLERLGLRAEAAQLRSDADAITIEKLPLSEAAQIRTEEEQIGAFLSGYAAGWRRLEEAIGSVLRDQIVETPISAIMQPLTAIEPPAPSPVPVEPVSREAPTAAPGPEPITAEAVARTVVVLEDPPAPIESPIVIVDSSTSAPANGRA